MFLYRLLIICQLWQFSEQISCYDCPEAPTIYPSLITTDTIPMEIQNCTKVTGKRGCTIELQWFITDQKTYIRFSSISSNKRSISISTDDQLTVDVLQDGTGVIARSINSFNYQCFDEDCSHISRFKSLLESLTIKSSFADLDPILLSPLPFQGRWCTLSANFTDDTCPSPVNINQNDCKQCIGQFILQPDLMKTCSSCNIHDFEQDTVQRTRTFKMFSRTISEKISILCRSQSCSEQKTIELIQSKSAIDFDFDRFLNPKPSKAFNVHPIVSIVVSLLSFFTIIRLHW